LNLLPPENFEGPENGSGTGHIVFHHAHIEAWLKRNPSRIESDPFPDKNQRRILLHTGWRVFQNDDVGRFQASLSDRQKGPHPHLFSYLRIDHL
jgi:hypothetical protein